jgi:hypothetical protein
MPLMRLEADQKVLRARLFDVASKWRVFQTFEVQR